MAFKLYLPGREFPINSPPAGAEGYNYSWNNVKSYSTMMLGDGPWVVGIRATGDTEFSGLFAGITLNGQPFTKTGVSSTKFKATTKMPPRKWLEPNFNTSQWKTGAELAPYGCTNLYWDTKSNGTFTQKLQEQMPEQTINASWLPGCRNGAKNVYFRVLIQKPKYVSRQGNYVRGHNDGNSAFSYNTEVKVAANENVQVKTASTLSGTVNLVNATAQFKN